MANVGVVGVLDGSPKADHYPYHPERGDVGWSEGWVAFNAAWNAGLAWRAADCTTLRCRPAEGADADRVAPGSTLDVTLLVNGTVRRAVDVRQRDPDGRYYDGRIDLASLDLDAGDEITLRYGSGVFDVEEVVIAA